MNKIFFNVLTYPIFFGSLISMAIFSNPVHSQEYVFKAPKNLTCHRVSHLGKLACTRVMPTDNSQATLNSNSPSNNNDDVSMLDFTEEESDAAIAMYGCDCPRCLNSLRQLRGLSPVDNT